MYMYMYILCHACHMQAMTYATIMWALDDRDVLTRSCLLTQHCMYIIIFGTHICVFGTRDWYYGGTATMTHVPL